MESAWSHLVLVPGGIKHVLPRGARLIRSAGKTAACVEMLTLKCWSLHLRAEQNLDDCLTAADMQVYGQPSYRLIQLGVTYWWWWNNFLYDAPIRVLSNVLYTVLCNNSMIGTLLVSPPTQLTNATKRHLESNGSVAIQSFSTVLYLAETMEGSK